MKTVVIGASSGLGRCIGIGLAKRGSQVALMARRLGNLESAREEAGDGAIAVECDVTDAEACRAAIDHAAEALGGIDALVYTPAIGPLGMLTETDPDTWARVFATNVIGATVATNAALPHLEASSGNAIYLSSVSASQTAPWPGLGAYAVSKAALDKLIQAYEVEHPGVGFTRLVVGDCVGGEGDGGTQFANGWDPDQMVEFSLKWIDLKLIAGAFIDIEHLTDVVDNLTRSGASLSMPTVVVAPRRPAPEPAG